MFAEVARMKDLLHEIRQENDRLGRMLQRLCLKLKDHPDRWKIWDEEVFCWWLGRTEQEAAALLRREQLARGITRHQQDQEMVRREWENA
jgi:hypothetical protein